VIGSPPRHTTQEFVRYCESFSSRAELRQLADYSGVLDSASGVAKLAVSSRYQRPRIRFSASFNYRHPSAGLVAPLTIQGGMTIC
jgi:hypothetical protein